MKNGVQMIYSTHARWYVSIPTTVDRRGRIRRALVRMSPHYDAAHFVELEGHADDESRICAAAQLVETLFWDEDWFRRPRQIRCDTVELTTALTRLLGEQTHVRTDAHARCFRAIQRQYRAQVMG